MGMSDAERDAYTKYNKQCHVVSSVDKLPSSAQFFVFQNETRSYPDPYGGSSSCTDNYLTVAWFESEEALNWWILREAESHYSKKFKVFYAHPGEVKLHTTVSVKL